MIAVFGWTREPDRIVAEVKRFETPEDARLFMAALPGERILAETPEQQQAIFELLNEIQREVAR